ncbi:MAG: hypothetical protein ABSF71_29970 [Terriglobia bacterium]
MYKPSPGVLRRLCAACIVMWAMTASPFRAGQNPSPPAPPPKDSGGAYNDSLDWQMPTKSVEVGYDAAKWWGGFPKVFDASHYKSPDWIIGPFTKYAGNPILEPTPGSWDRGHYGGGVHNGSVLFVDGQFCYIYRGERELGRKPGYICDIGLATSKDGIHFTKDTVHSPFFGKGKDKDFSFEDVCLVRFKGMYYLFCNVWDWTREGDPKASGAFLATSKDLVNWTKLGLIFPDAKEIHRNPVVLQNPDNEPVKANGKYVMYLDSGLMAFSGDLVHWTSKKVSNPWPGGENCVALADWNPKYADNILLFTSGHHSGHFYAVGEVLLDRNDPEKAIAWLPRPIFTAEAKYPWEDGKAAQPPHARISSFHDTIFFTGFMRHAGQWWMYYGGSEYYTCLATCPAPAKK